VEVNEKWGREMAWITADWTWLDQPLGRGILGGDENPATESSVKKNETDQE
jgi:hypothetical protein